MTQMLSANFLTGIHCLPGPARLELGLNRRQIQNTYLEMENGQRPWIYEQEAGRGHEESRDKSLSVQ